MVVSATRRTKGCCQGATKIAELKIEATELDLDTFLNRAWGTKVSFVIAAYNDMAPIGAALLLGLEASCRHSRA